MATVATGRPAFGSKTNDERPTRRKKEARTDIWSNLLRQTREAQARSRTHAVQSRELIVCGGSADDQRAFVQTLARPPPPSVPGRNSRDGREKRPKGEVVLSNRFAYGYGHLTLFSPPPQGAGLLGNDSEEVAKVGIHTVPEPDVGYEQTLRSLMQPRRRNANADEEEDVDNIPEKENSEDQDDDRRPSIVLLLSWKEPWRFLELLRRWLQLLARSLLQPNGPPEDPIEVLKEHQLNFTVVIQHVEAQEQLERDNYKEESFDYISQCVRTCLLPLSAAILYTPSAPPALSMAQGVPLTEVQKVLYSSLGLDLTALSAKSGGGGPAVKKEDLMPKHNVVDRMAIVVPSGWDSVGKIRLLSETFSPEAIMEGWLADVNSPVFLPPAPTEPPNTDVQADSESKTEANEQQNDEEEKTTFETTGASTPVDTSSNTSAPISPSKLARSAILSYENQVQDPQAHKAPQPPRIEVTTKPEQEFLAEMRTQLQLFDEKDRERQKREPGSIATASTTGGGRGLAIPGGESSGALNNLGDVQFNVGGVNYNSVTAEAAIERLRRPAQPESPRTGTPRPPKREDREASGSRETPSRPTEIDTDKLEEYFHSLMKRGGGGGSSQSSTPSRSAGGR